MQSLLDFCVSVGELGGEWKSISCVKLSELGVPAKWMTEDAGVEACDNAEGGGGGSLGGNFEFVRDTTVRGIDIGVPSFVGGVFERLAPNKWDRILTDCWDPGFFKIGGGIVVGLGGGGRGGGTFLFGWANWKLLPFVDSNGVSSQFVVGV